MKGCIALYGASCALHKGVSFSFVLSIRESRYERQLREVKRIIEERVEQEESLYVVRSYRGLVLYRIRVYLLYGVLSYRVYLYRRIFIKSFFFFFCFLSENAYPLWQSSEAIGGFTIMTIFNNPKFFRLFFSLFVLGLFFVPGLILVIALLTLIYDVVFSFGADKRFTSWLQLTFVKGTRKSFELMRGKRNPKSQG